MCDELGGSDAMDMDSDCADIGSADVSTDASESLGESGIFDVPQDSFEEMGIFDDPQEGLAGLEETPDGDVYTAATLDETMILEEGGGIHSIAERMAQLEAEDADISEPGEPYEAKTLDEIMILEEGGGVHSIAERMAELEAEDEMPESLEPSAGDKIGRLTELRDCLLAGDQATLEMFGMETPDADADEGGFQKVKTR